MAISVKNISKRYGDYTALDNVSLEIKQGELVALLGPSGSGKTSLLRIIAGLDTADSGHVMVDGKHTGQHDVRDRNVGFVFQHYALFKHMTVFENVAFGLRVRKPERRPSEAVIRQKVLELLRLVHLEGFHQRYPSQLSGGQRQRVALARALAVEPSLLLLDEPFGALDAKVRKELRRWMRRLHDDIHITSVFVTHDQEEAMEVADRVVVMSQGHIEQVGTPSEVWNKPVNGFVYDFLGNYNEFEGWVAEDGSIHLTEYDVVDAPVAEAIKIPDDWRRRFPKAAQFLKHIPGMTAPAALPMLPGKRNVKTLRGTGKAVKLYARPHEMFVAREPSGHDYIAARIIHINPAGPLVRLELERRNGILLQAEIPAEVVTTLKLDRHQDVYVRPKQTKMFEQKSVPKAGEKV